jgi:hypothetical protein
MKSPTLTIAALLLCGAAFAGAPAAGSGNIPTVEAASESFELVGQLAGGELAIMIDRFDTNEPVLQGDLEVQYKNLKAKARFEAGEGAFAVSDEKMLKALSAPGKHALLFTLVAGDESDLLEGTLEVAPEAHTHADTPRWTLGAGAAALAVLGALAAAVLIRRRKGAY